MKRLIQPAASCLLVVFAMAWPWDVYQYVPWIGMHLTGLAALGLILLWIADLTLNRRNRVPFELAWPAAALLTFLWIPAVADHAPFPITESSFILLFVAVCHFGPTGGEAARYLVYSAISGMGVAMLSILSFTGILMPTAYSLDTGATLACAHDIAGGFVALLVCLILGRSFEFGKRRVWWHYLVVAIGSVVMVVALAAVAMRVAATFGVWRLPRYGGDSLWTLAAFIVCLWLAARVAAKLLVAWRMSGRRAAARFFGVCAAIIAVAVCMPLMPRSAYAFLFGMAAACARAKEEEETAPAFARWGWLALALVVVLNMRHVYPENTLDPRYYDAAAAQDMRAGNLELLERRMSFFEERSPGESRTRLWRARAALERGLPDKAASEFADCLGTAEEENSAALLPPPTAAEQDDFLTRLRDYCSSLPKADRVFAYERALVAAGRDDAALAALRLRVIPPSGDVRPQVRERPTETLARLLGNERLADRLAEWPAGDIESILEQMEAAATGAGRK